MVSSSCGETQGPSLPSKGSSAHVGAQWHQTLTSFVSAKELHQIIILGSFCHIDTITSVCGLLWITHGKLYEIYLILLYTEHKGCHKRCNHVTPDLFDILTWSHSQRLPAAASRNESVDDAGQMKINVSILNSKSWIPNKSEILLSSVTDGSFPRTKVWTQVPPPSAASVTAVLLRLSPSPYVRLSPIARL